MTPLTPKAGPKFGSKYEDTDIGIPQADLGKLFQDFTQVDSSVTRRYGGTGLGLAVTRQLIELMHGRVGVQSTLGRGSTFWFEIALPAGTQAAAGEAAKLPDQQIYARAAATGNEPDSRALVAEDNAINRKLVVAYLEKMGLRADTVENGRQAVDAVRSRWYDIVLMDVQMPEMDGFEAAKEIRRLPGERGQVPIIAITAFTSSEDIERCIAAGMNDFVSKPIDRAQLRDAVEKWSQDKDGTSDTHATEPAALSPADNEIIEPGILKGLAESLGADKTRELVALYIDDIQSRLQRLLKAADAQDFATLRKEAHDVRSTSGSLGLTRLFALGEGIAENACADGREAGARLAVMQRGRLSMRENHRRSAPNAVSHRRFWPAFAALALAAPALPATAADEPGQRFRVQFADLPAPGATPSARNAARAVRESSPPMRRWQSPTALRSMSLPRGCLMPDGWWWRRMATCSLRSQTPGG